VVQVTVDGRVVAVVVAKLARLRLLHSLAWPVRMYYRYAVPCESARGKCHAQPHVCFCVLFLEGSSLLQDSSAKPLSERFTAACADSCSCQLRRDAAIWLFRLTGRVLCMWLGANILPTARAVGSLVGLCPIVPVSGIGRNALVRVVSKF
jgi:hypothetical protein